MDESENEKTQPNKVSNPVEETKPVKVQSGVNDLSQDAVPQNTAETATPGFGGSGTIEDTSPVKIAARKPRRWPWIVGGIALIVALGVLGGYLGYLAAIKLQTAQSSEQIAMAATEQFMLGMKEQEAGQYENALKRFQYVIQLDPGFPGAQQKLTEVMMSMAASKTPTVVVVVATATMTPTPDFRGEEEIFNNARQLMVEKKWIDALNVMDTLRNKNLTYRALEVDGMYYEALQFRGLSRVNTGNLEAGLYDLAVAERFAPLDTDALGVRTWARLYLTGAAFWGVDWDKVVYYFAQIYPYYPNLRDINGTTAVDRYRKGLIHLGDKLFLDGKYCDAVQQYDSAQKVANDGALAPTMTEADNKCKGPSATPKPPTATPTFTPSPTLALGTTVVVPPAATTEVPPVATTAVPPAATTEVAPVATTAVPPVATTAVAPAATTEVPRTPTATTG
jgi:tetratricopeptide (TPR) repeat protein